MVFTKGKSTSAGGAKKKPTSKRAPNYITVLGKICKNTNPMTSFSREAMLVSTGVVEDFQDRLIEKAIDLCRIDGKSTIQPKHALAATQSLLTGELRLEAIEAGSHAVSRFNECQEAAMAGKAERNAQLVDVAV